MSTMSITRFFILLTLAFVAGILLTNAISQGQAGCSQLWFQMVASLSSLKFVSRDESILNIASAVVTIWGFLWVIPYFLYQEEIRKTVSNSEHGLRLISQIEKRIEYLLGDGKADKNIAEAISMLTWDFRFLKDQSLVFLDKKKIHIYIKWIDAALCFSDRADFFDFIKNGDSVFGPAKKQMDALKEELGKIHKNPEIWWKRLSFHIILLICFVCVLSLLRSFDS